MLIGIVLATAGVLKHTYPCGHSCVGHDWSVTMKRVGIVAVIARPAGSSLRLILKIRILTGQNP